MIILLYFSLNHESPVLLGTRYENQGPDSVWSPFYDSLSCKILIYGCEHFKRLLHTRPDSFPRGISVFFIHQNRDFMILLYDSLLKVLPIS